MSNYCCEFMRQQLEYDCKIHGPACPDIVVRRRTEVGRQDELMLVGRNADYDCNFCPSCGSGQLECIEEGSTKDA